MTTSVGIYDEKRSYVNKLLHMTVPELYNELNYNLHTVVEQQIIMDIIRKRSSGEFLCQADKNFLVKFRKDPCIRGVPLTEPKNADLSKYCLQATPDTCPMNVVSASLRPDTAIPEDPTNPNARNVVIKDNYNPPYYKLNDFVDPQGRHNNTCSGKIPCVKSKCIYDPSSSAAHVYETNDSRVPYTLVENRSGCKKQVSTQSYDRFTDDITAIKKMHGLI